MSVTNTDLQKIGGAIVGKHKRVLKIRNQQGIFRILPNLQEFFDYE